MNKKISLLLKGKGVRYVVILGLAGMALILFSDIFSGSSSKTAEKETSEPSASIEYKEYVSEMESRLRGILEKIGGVGKAEVMITAAGSGEYVYAKDEKSDTDGSSISRDEKYVIIGGGNKNALVRKIDNPEITGVVVVCEGGESNVVREKVYSAVAAAFDIPSQKIFVTGA